jgi:hypothetical protein
MPRKKKESTMATTARVMRLWMIWRNNALAITIGDIGRVGLDRESIKVLDQWTSRLRSDQKALEEFARNEWTEDERDVIRSIWRSRKILADACRERADQIDLHLAEVMELEERVSSWLEESAIADRR